MAGKAGFEPACPVKDQPISNLSVKLHLYVFIRLIRAQRVTLVHTKKLGQTVD